MSNFEKVSQWEKKAFFWSYHIANVPTPGYSTSAFLQVMYADLLSRVNPPSTPTCTPFTSSRTSKILFSILSVPPHPTTGSHLSENKHDAISLALKPHPSINTLHPCQPLQFSDSRENLQKSFMILVPNLSPHTLCNLTLSSRTDPAKLLE